MDVAPTELKAYLHRSYINIALLTERKRFQLCRNLSCLVCATVINPLALSEMTFARGPLRCVSAIHAPRGAIEYAQVYWQGLSWFSRQRRLFKWRH